MLADKFIIRPPNIWWDKKKQLTEFLLCVFEVAPKGFGGERWGNRISTNEVISTDAEVFSTGAIFYQTHMKTSVMKSFSNLS